MLAPASLEMERTLLGPRTETALAYARANGINPIERHGTNEWIGIVASGKSYRDLRQALADMGLDDYGLAHAGVRILHPAMIWPLDPDVVKRFAAGPRRDRRGRGEAAVPRAPDQGDPVRRVARTASRREARRKGSRIAAGRGRDRRGRDRARPRPAAAPARPHRLRRGPAAQARRERLAAAAPADGRPHARSSAPAARTTARRRHRRARSSAPGSAATR